MQSRLERALQARRSGIKNKERREIWTPLQEYMGEVRSFNKKGKSRGFLCPNDKG